MFKARFWTHSWISKLLPPTNVADVSDAVIDGIAYRQDVVTVPNHMAVMGVVFHLLPAGFRSRLVRRLGLGELI